MKMPCRPLRGSSSCSTTEQAPQPMWTRHDTSCLQRRTMSSLYNRQVPPSSNMSDELCTRAGISGARLWFLHQHYPPQLTGEWMKNSDQMYEPHWTTLLEAS